jgi:hypothetical protein
MLLRVASVHSTVGIIAIAAAAVAAVSLLFCVFLGVRLRRMRDAQRTVLGNGSVDLVGHPAELQRQFQALYNYVQDAVGQLNGRLNKVEQRLDGTMAYRALVHYDAYGEMSGRQSTTIALLDAHRSGLVLSSIHHRDQARLYAKQIRRGEPEHELSPEETQAIRLALGEDRPDQASA